MIVSRDLRYPTGQFIRPEGISLEQRQEAVRTLAELPGLLRLAVEGLTDAHLEMPYREGGWTVRQVVHHVADSHMNVFVRLRLALTEEWPTARLYDQDEWAELADSKHGPVEWSLEILRNLHARWVAMLRGLTEEQWQRGYHHRDDGKVTVELAALLYAWHSRHHLTQITNLRAGRGW